MKQKIKNRTSLYMEWFLTLIIAAAAAFVFFMISHYAVENLIDNQLEKKDLIRTNNDKYAEELQIYITENSLASMDFVLIDEWVKDRKVLFLQMNKDGEWIYSSEYNLDELKKIDFSAPNYHWDNYYDIKFFDGIVQVCITGMYAYQIYNFTLIMEIAVAFLLFFSISMTLFRRKMRYIQTLSRDIKILEGGNLKYEVTTLGNDELTELADGINAMRISFQKQIDKADYLANANQSMVTELSHDLRTPLTSILLYAEILQNGKNRDEAQKQEYMDKIVKRIHHMKGLSDHLLQYSMKTRGTETVQVKSTSIQMAFYDELSDMCGYLEEHGIIVQANLEWRDFTVSINDEYISRILNNVSSNILKYADRQEVISIRNEYSENEFRLIIENACRGEKPKLDSTNIGLNSIHNMMEQMNGRCTVNQNGDVFSVCIAFGKSENTI